MSNIHYKYPRTYHLPWSLGVTSDDKVLKDINYFINKEVIVTEKMDGENSTLYSKYFHARSIDSNDHESQHWLKQFHSTFSYNIPDNYRLCGENVYAEHSIHYDTLPSYFLLFSIWNEKNICLSWDDTLLYAEMLGIKTVPILYRGIWNEELIRKCYTGVSKYGKVQEGYVVRLVNEFSFEEFDKCVAKFVRKNHVQTDSHWKNKQIIKNGLCI